MLTSYTPEMEANSNKIQIFLGILEVSLKIKTLISSHKKYVFQESLAVDDRILLFSQSLFTLNLIEEFLRRKKLTKAEVNTSMSTK